MIETQNHDLPDHGPVIAVNYRNRIRARNTGDIAILSHSSCATWQ